MELLRIECSHTKFLVPLSLLNDKSKIQKQLPQRVFVRCTSSCVDSYNEKDLEQIMVVRRDHGVEKKIPLQPKVCSQCGSVSFFVDNPKTLKISSNDKPIDPNFKTKPILESDF